MHSLIGRVLRQRSSEDALPRAEDILHRDEASAVYCTQLSKVLLRLPMGRLSHCPRLGLSIRHMPALQPRFHR